MLKNFRGKCIKDTENASETVITNSTYSDSMFDSSKNGLSMPVTFQQQNSDTFDSYIEKRNRK